MYRENNLGPTKEPCGTPYEISLVSEEVSFISIN